MCLNVFVLLGLISLSFPHSFYTYDAANLLSVTTSNQTTRYTYNLNSDLTKVIYPTSAAVQYSWNQFGLLSGITGFNKENRLIQGFYFSYDWNGKVTTSRLPQGDSAEFGFNEEAKIMHITGDSFSKVRFESVSNNDQVVRTIKQGDQVQIMFYLFGNNSTGNYYSVAIRTIREHFDNNN